MNWSIILPIETYILMTYSVLLILNLIFVNGNTLNNILNRSNNINLIKYLCGNSKK